MPEKFKDSSVPDVSGAASDHELKGPLEMESPDGKGLAKRDFLRHLAVVILIGLAVRSVVLVVRFSELQSDPDAYRMLAENFARFGGLGHEGTDGNLHPTAFRPPAYPWLLSWFVSDGKLGSMGVAVLHALLGAATIGCVFAGTLRVLSRRFGWFAAMLVAVDPILLNQSTLVMTETLATFVVAAVWMLVLRSASARQDFRFREGLIIGTLLAAGFLTRPVFIVWTFFIVLTLAFHWFRMRKQSRETNALQAAVVICLVMAVVVGLWTMRNVRAVGKPVWATSHGGYTLLLGNNPPFYEYLREGRFGNAWDAEFFHATWAKRDRGDPRAADFWIAQKQTLEATSVRRTEIEDDRLAYETAKATISRQPKMFAASCFVRLGRLWSPLPHAGSLPAAVRYAIALFYVATFALVLFGLARLSRRLLEPAWLVALFLAFALSGVHSVYWSNMRMRAIATPVLAVVAAVGAQSVVSRRDRSR